MSEQSEKLIKITMSLTRDTIDTLRKIGRECGYGSASATVRVLTKKYGNKELEQIGKANSN